MSDTTWNDKEFDAAWAIAWSAGCAFTEWHHGEHWAVALVEFALLTLVMFGGLWLKRRIVRALSRWEVRRVER